ncbi:hypothetical protein PALB_34210 [Pseudoalteromonas luteoviolacea B = ATCC 29581]|nr:hypothetical protein PALB_34210 [Pseudoalteromonas luteoviolacea B = ATCC 29581]
MALWLYVHFPQLQLDCEFINTEKNLSILCSDMENDATHCKAKQYASNENAPPVIVVSGKQNSVVQLNYAARKLGVRLGMGLGAAAALSKDLIVLPFDEARTVSRLTEIADWLYLVSADLVLFPPSGVLLNVTNMLVLYGSLSHYWQQLESHLMHCNVSYTYASGYSPLAAQVLAKQKANLLSDDKEALLALLGQQPLHVSPLSSSIIESLSRLGIRNFASLFAIPLAELGRRFDQGVVQYVGRMLGHFQHPVTWYQPPETFSRSISLLFELETLAWIEKPLMRLLEQLEVFLRVRDALAYELKIALIVRDKPDQIVMVSAAEGEYRANAWLALCHLTLSNTQLSAPLQSIQLSVVQMMQRTLEARDLFSEKRSGLSAKALLSILQAKLGKHAIQGVGLSEDPRPELASYSVAPLSRLETRTQSEALLRPTLMLPSPYLLDTEVEIVHGPERLSTGWWDGCPQTRDYFIARDKSGRWLWVYRDECMTWYVHGVFS